MTDLTKRIAEAAERLIKIFRRKKDSGCQYCDGSGMRKWRTDTYPFIDGEPCTCPMGYQWRRAYGPRHGETEEKWIDMLRKAEAKLEALLNSGVSPGEGE